MAAGALSLLVACDTPPDVPERVAGMDVSLAGSWTRTTRGLPITAAAGSVGISRTLEIPAVWDDARVILRARGAGWRVTAAVDGAPVASDVGGIRPIALDLTGALRPGVRTLSLTFEAATPANVLSGETVSALSAWTYDAPPGARVGSEMWLEVGGERRIDGLDVRLRDGALTATAEVVGAEGEPVALTVVRDGEVLGVFPPAVVTGGRAEATIPWDGPLWRLGGSEAPFLQYLVARLPSGETRQARFGAREVRWEGRAIAVNGEPTYLAVERITPTGADDRRDVAAAAARFARAGLNGLEVHAIAHGGAVLDAADELGLFTVLTPMCDGRFRAEPGFVPDARWAAFMAEQNERIVEAAGAHPSLTLWNLEAEPLPWPEVHAPFHGTGTPWVDMRHSAGFSDASYLRGLPSPLPLFFNELPWREATLDGRTIPERLAWLLAAHRDAGAGLVLPHPDTLPGYGGPEGAERFAATTRALLSAEAVPAFTTGDRRGPATVLVAVSHAGRPAEGRLVTMRVPGQATMGAFTDERGEAELLVDYAGEVSVGVLGGGERVSVATKLGRYTGGAWVPGVTRVDLDSGP